MKSGFLLSSGIPYPHSEELTQFSRCDRQFFNIFLEAESCVIAEVSAS